MILLFIQLWLDFLRKSALAHTCLRENCNYKLVLRRWEWEQQPLGLLQQVPPGLSVSPPHESGKTGCKKLLESGRVPACSQQHQRAGSQGWDGPQQSPDQLVCPLTHLFTCTFCFFLSVIVRFFIFLTVQSLWLRRRRRLQLVSSCPGGVCSLAGSCWSPSVWYLLTSPCCMAFSTAKRNPLSGLSLWVCPFLRASSYCSL